MLAVFYILLKLVMHSAGVSLRSVLPYAIEIDEWRDKGISIEGAVIPA